MQGKKIKAYYNGQWRNIEIDGHSGGLVVTTLLHHLVHEGRVFHYNEYVPLNEGKSKSIVFKTSENYIHLFWQLRGIYDCVIETYGGTIIDDYGPENSLIINKNHNSTFKTSVKIFNDAEIADDGMALSTWRWLMPDLLDAVLRPNVDYHIKFKNQHAGKNYINITSYWHERQRRVLAKD